MFIKVNPYFLHLKIFFQMIITVHGTHTHSTTPMWWEMKIIHFFHSRERILIPWSSSSDLRIPKQSPWSGSYKLLVFVLVNWSKSFVLHLHFAFQQNWVIIWLHLIVGGHSGYLYCFHQNIFFQITIWACSTKQGAINASSWWSGGRVIQIQTPQWSCNAKNLVRSSNGEIYCLWRGKNWESSSSIQLFWDFDWEAGARQ